jgi:hypothetical protein
MHCGGCVHRDRDQLDRQIVAGVPYRTLEPVYDLSIATISRHARHVRQLIKERLPHERAKHGTDLISRVEKIITEAEEILVMAKSGKDLRAAILALGAIGKQLELIARLSGGLSGAGGLTLNFNANNTTINNFDGSDLDLALAIAESTQNYDPIELQRLKTLAESTITIR